jgi:hypothetical protein
MSGAQDEVRRRGSRLTGPIGARLWARRNKVKQLAADHGLSNLRVFGSVVRGAAIDAIWTHRARRVLGVLFELVPDLREGVKDLVGGCEVPEVALSWTDDELNVAEQRGCSFCLIERNKGIRVAVPPAHWNFHV